MANDHIRQVLYDIESGAISAEEGYAKLKLAPFEDLGYAKVDHHRPVRQGAPEVIYGASKTKEQIEGIVNSLLSHCPQNILITRLSPESADYLNERFELFYDPLSRIGIVNRTEHITAKGAIVVATGGTSDIPVAEEAALTAEEGALASVIGGLADCPVIGVPTSVGYGASFQGLSALLSMLNSCASGVSVVNIDNGFGAGYLASMINHIGA